MASIKIGLEVHGYLHMDNKAKLFCDCKVDAAQPNEGICPICTGMPGSKPMAANKDAVGKIISIAGMLDCRINTRLLFQRKHYDWPDMPTGYQRTMSGSYSVPVGERGMFLGIGIADVHLEEDPAKWDPETGLVDYNRSGFPLVEIVTNPDFTSPQLVREWLKKLVTTLSYINAIDAGAGIKSDVNVSVAPDFNRVEIKNVNSFKSIIQAIEYEVRRQEQQVKGGNKIPQETRAWNDSAGVTVFMRKKEQAADYMFIPDPDLPVIILQDSEVSSIISGLPERPAQKIERYIRQLKIDRTDAEILSSEIYLAEKFEKVVAKKIDPVLAARWFRRELLRVLNYSKKELHEIEADEHHLAQLLRLVEKKKITDEVAKRLLEKLVEKPFDVEKHVQSSGLTAVSDAATLTKLCRQALEKNKKAVEDYKSGNGKALNFIVGKIMAETKGKANPQELAKLLKKLVK